MSANLEQLAATMAERAIDFLVSLGEDQSAKARLPLEDEAELSNWYYTPTLRRGLSLNEMAGRQQRLAHRFLASGLSTPAYATACAIIGLDNALDAREGWRNGSYPGGDAETRGRDPGMYFFAVFGDPAYGTWAWRVGGHHLSVHRTIVEGKLVASTPIFFGADPAAHEGMGGVIFRPLAGEEDRGRTLVQMFDAAQRASAVISPRAPFDIVQSNRPRIEDGALPLDLGSIFSMQRPALNTAFERMRTEIERDFVPGDREAHRYESSQPKGIAGAEMTPSQRDALAHLVAVYLERLPDDAAAAESARLHAAGLESLHFAWAGSLEPRQPHYYRIQGPRFLVEYDNVQNGANHIHAVWRDPEGDFGRDILANHHAIAHAR
jgi:Protein of unknown function (DUF3500)